MAQVITADLTALLVDKLQVGAKKCRGEIEIDHVEPTFDPIPFSDLVVDEGGAGSGGTPVSSWAAPSVDSADDNVFEIACIATNPRRSLSLPGGWTSRLSQDVVNSDDDDRYTVADRHHATAAGPYAPTFGVSGGAAKWSMEHILVKGRPGETSARAKGQAQTGVYADGGSVVDRSIEVTLDVTPLAGNVLVAFFVATTYAGVGGGTGASWAADGWEYHGFAPSGDDAIPGVNIYAKLSDGSERISTLTLNSAHQRTLELQIVEYPLATEAAGGFALVTTRFAVTSLNLDRSRKLAAAQLNALFDNVDGAKGWYTQASPIFTPNNRIRAFAWLGARSNRVRVFTGLVDRAHEHRNPRTIELKARSRMKWLIQEQFRAAASQSVDDTTAVRTEANGVYANRSPEYIVGKILDRAGWPTADRVIASSGVTIAEYDLADKSSWLDQIVGTDRLTGTAGFDFWEDELGRVHFEPSPLSAVDEPDPDWEFAAGVNVLELDHEVDDEARATRVVVSGPMTSDVPAWKQEWATSVLLHPVGVMYRASESGYLYVVDRVTQYLYKLRQSDRAIVAPKWPLAAALTNQPIGLSGDPTDSAHFYVLDAHLPGSGTYTNCKVRKFDMATKALVATTTLPDGQWSDMKFDGSHLYLTNFGDDKLYVKTFVAGGAAGATSSHSYAGKTNPTGLYLTGTTIGLFFNGGTAFYLVDTSAPGTITGTQSTKGTKILGGEAVGSVLYATNEAGDFGATAGHVWKFQLTEEITTTVTKQAVDVDLEDALGFQSGIADRVHDQHSGDAAHPFEVRELDVAMKVVNSPAQAQAVADATLQLVKRLRRVMDLATSGHPGVQINDVVRYTDAIAGIDSVWVVDSYRVQVASGRYTQTKSVLPWEAAG